MKTIARILVIFSLIFGLVGFFKSLPAQAALNAVDTKLTTEFGQKIDLNNSHIRQFRELPGFYPNLASQIIKNAPYKKVEAVLDIKGLSESQKERLQANLDRFTVTEPSQELIEGDDRINPGIY